MSLKDSSGRNQGGMDALLFFCRCHPLVQILFFLHWPLNVGSPTILGLKWLAINLTGIEFTQLIAMVQTSSYIFKGPSFDRSHSPHSLSSIDLSVSVHLFTAPYIFKTIIKKRAAEYNCINKSLFISSLTFSNPSIL